MTVQTIPRQARGNRGQHELSVAPLSACLGKPAVKRSLLRPAKRRNGRWDGMDASTDAGGIGRVRYCALCDGQASRVMATRQGVCAGFKGNGAGLGTYVCGAAVRAVLEAPDAGNRRG